jgi:hypothetical protein
VSVRAQRIAGQHVDLVPIIAARCIEAALADAAAMIGGMLASDHCRNGRRLIRVAMTCHVQMLCFCTWRSRCAAGNGRKPVSFRATNSMEVN